MRIYLSGNEEKIIELNQSDEGYILEFNNETYNIYTREIGVNNYFSFDKLKWSKLVTVKGIEATYLLDQKYLINAGFKPSGQGSVDFGSLVTQMPGKVIKISVQEGDLVKKGETLLILEAMKMENEIKSGIDAKIKSIHVSENQNIDSGQLLIELEETEV